MEAILDDILTCIFVNENVEVSLTFSLKIVPKVRIDNIPAFGVDNGLAPTRGRPIIWINDG